MGGVFEDPGQCVSVPENMHVGANLKPPSTIVPDPYDPVSVGLLSRLIRSHSSDGFDERGAVLRIVCGLDVGYDTCVSPVSM